MTRTDSALPVAVSRGSLPLARFVAYAATALALTVLFLLSWKLREILLLAFGAVVFAAIIRAVASPLVRRFPRREKLAVGAAILLLLGAFAGLAWLFGYQIGEQVRGLAARLPDAITAGKNWIQQFAVGRWALENAPGQEDLAGGLGGVGKVAAVTFDSFGHALLMLVAAIYLALTPRVYVDGLVQLFPRRQRSRLLDALRASGETLQRWLLGQLISMATIGTLTTVGLWAVGCPVPLALGILSGLLTFVPVVGFILSFVPTVLIALSESPSVALYAIIVFLVVQQLEEQVVLPLAQRWATSLPPALGLLALAAAGALFGLPGLVFGCPLTVVIMCLVQRLYLGAERGAHRPRDRTGIGPSGAGS